MSYSSLRDFLDRLEADGQLVRITEPVSTDREITEIHRRTLEAGGPALLFENVIKEDGTPAEMPVLVNLFGTVERDARGVTLGGNARRTAGTSLREVGETACLSAPARAARRASAKRFEPDPAGAQDRALAMKPKRRRRAFGRQGTVRRRSFCKATRSIWARLPIQTCWPNEPAPLDHLAADRHPGPGAAKARGQIRRLQFRHLPHAGDAAGTRRSCAG